MMAPRKKAQNSNDDDDPPPSSITATLVELVNTLTQVLTTNSALQLELRTLTSDHKKLQEAHQQLLERVETLEKSSGDWTQASTRRQHSTTSDLEALTCTVADELQARTEKQSNVVIYGLPELPSVDDQPATEEDEKKKVSDLLKDDLSITQPSVVRAYRMGRPRTDGRPRPIKVHLPDSTQKRTVLDNAKKLGKLPDTHAHKKVYIRSDWTAMQREQDYKRRQELRQHNASTGSDNQQNQRNSSRGNNSQT